jgi:protoporphyrinogen oxidase
MNIVVGGGIAGILAAILLEKKYGSAWLIEKENDIGGLYRSIETEHGIWFDYGTHFVRSTSIPEIDDIILDGITDRDWRIFGNLDAGNYYGAALNPSSPFVDTRQLPAGIYERAMIELLTATEPASVAHNIREQLSATFGPTLTDHLFRPILSDKYYGCDLDELSVNAHMLLGLGRVLGFTPESSIELKKLPVYDSKLGFHSSKMGASAQKNFYPIGRGISAWIELLKKKITKLNITVLTNTSVDHVEHGSGRLKSVILSDKRRIACDRLVWTIPVPAFLKAAAVGARMPQPPMRRLYTSVYHFVFDRPFLTNVHYLHCHAPKLRTFRTTIYSNIQRNRGDVFHLTSGVISPVEVDLEVTRDLVLGELQQMGIVSPDAKILFQSPESIPNGFPLQTVAFQAAAEQLASLAESIADNAYFIGRSAGKSFTTDSLLPEVHAAIRKMDAGTVAER